MLGVVVQGEREAIAERTVLMAFDVTEVGDVGACWIASGAATNASLRIFPELT
jgi:hypothetical protein